MSTQAPVTTIFERILIATDFSDASQRAVEYAMALARRESSRIMLAHVNPIVSTINPDASWITQKEIWRQTEEQLAQDTAELRSLGFQAQSMSLTGRIEDELLAAVKRERVDLMVLGTQADRGIQRLLFGSDAEALLRNAGCAVLVVGPGAEPLGNRQWHPAHVICPSDLAPGSAAIVAHAYMLAEQYHAAFTLLHIEDPSSKSRGDEAAEFQRELGKLLPDALPLMQRLHQRLSDEPGYAIVDFAMENKADLIVMGVHAAPASMTHMLRGIAPQVFAKSPCPVMVLHMPRS